MKLYDAESAPSPRRVRIFLAEKGLEIEHHKLDLRSGEHFSTDFLGRNPCATVPCMELDDGTVIHEAASICLYLERLQPEPALLGVDARDQAVVDMWNRRIEQEGLHAVMEAFRNAHPAFENRALTGPHNHAQIPELAQRGRERAGHFLTMLDERLGASTHVAGETFTVADITTLVGVDFASAVQVAPFEGYTNIERWHASVSNRASAGA